MMVRDYHLGAGYQVQMLTKEKININCVVTIFYFILFESEVFKKLFIPFKVKSINNIAINNIKDIKRAILINSFCPNNNS